ncbi:MAG: PP2C family protein-serine/threonine phosphatase [Bacteroidota bacterium]
MERLKPLPFFLLILLSLPVVIWLYPSTHPYGGIHLGLDADAIVDRSRKILHELKVDFAGYNSEVQLKENRPLLRQTQRTFGLGPSNKMLRDSIPGYLWEVRWIKNTPSMKFSEGGDPDKQAEEAVKALKGDIYFQFDTHGQVLQFERKLSDSAHGARLTADDARSIARGFLKSFTAFGAMIGDTAATVSEKRTDQPFRTDDEYNWTTRHPRLGNMVKAKVVVAGDMVLGFSGDFNVPTEFSSTESEKVFGIALVVLYFIVAIVMVVVAFRRFRSFELGFRMAAAAGILVGVLYDVEIYLSAQGRIGWEILIPLLLIPLFVGGGLVLVWAVSESLVRETWREKFIPLDLLSKGHLSHSRVGESVLRGMAMGVAAFALWLILVHTTSLEYPIWLVRSDDSAVHTFDVSLPWLYVLGHSLYSNLYIFAFFVLFVISFLRKLFVSPVLVIFTASVAMGLLDHGHLYPLVLGVLVHTLVGAIFVWTFFRFDALATLFALVAYSAVEGTAGLFTAGNPTYAVSGYIVIAFFAVVATGSIAALYRKSEVVDFDSIAPAFARHISERQRLQQELEIARNVQMSFLPKANPSTFKLDIASRCAPALEVGGDYFDFIEIDKGRLGVAVGDVSGKGTQAAFFMTLTKGFLRALAKISNSPSVVLSQVNKLFYENVERGVFISMVYGVFDMRRRSLTLARAGHNPVIMRKSKANHVEVVNPMGLALGLDQGATFSKSIEEVRIAFRPGDLFVFYTDGFPEAMNKTLEEFGEERLCKTVERHAHRSAAEILEGIFAEMKEFVGKARQHDDMTIVVVKVL